MFKVLVIGYSSRSFFDKHTKNLFKSDSEMEIGIEFNIKKININNKINKLQLWNCYDEDRYKFLIPAYYRGSNGILFIFDITSMSTFKKVFEWLELLDINKKNNSIPMMLIGNKKDLEHEREVKSEHIKKACMKYGFSGYIECNFLTGYNVEEIFEQLTKDMIRKYC